MDQTLAGKCAVVTGATSGIGQVVATELAKRGARAVLVGRDSARMADALAALPAPAFGAHSAYLADLSRITEMNRLATEIAAAEPVVDILINNAGALIARRELTEDGLEKTFALNHMAYFVVTLGLLDRVRAAEAGRVIVTASRMHGMARMDFGDLQFSHHYSSTQAYARSKLCNILFTRALARRLGPGGVTANALHPGYVATRMGADDPSWFGRLDSWMKRFALSPQAGAQTTLHAALSEEGGRLSGAYFVKSRPVEPSAAARNDADGERLWALSAELAGISAEV